MLGQSLHEKTDAVDDDNEARAGDTEHHEQEADAVPIKPQIEAVAANPGRSTVGP